MSITDVDFYVLCLTDVPERMAAVHKMQETLPSLIISEAINAKDIPMHVIQHLKDTEFFVSRNGQLVDSLGRRYRRGALGIFLSHRTLLRTIYKKPAKDRKPFAIVFEDDVTLDAEFLPKLNHVMQTVKDIPFDILTLHTMDFQKTTFTPMNGESQLIRKCPGFCGLQCYMVRTDSLAPLLASLERFSDPIDEQISRHPTLNVMHYIGIEMVHEQRTIASVSTSTGALPIYENNENHEKIKKLSAFVQQPLPPRATLSAQARSMIRGMLHPLLGDTSIILHIDNPYTHDIISLCKSEMNVEPYHVTVGGHEERADINISTRYNAAAIMSHHAITVDVVFMMSDVEDISKWFTIMTPGGFMYGNAASVEKAQKFTMAHNMLLMAEEGFWCLRKPVLPNVTA